MSIKFTVFQSPHPLTKHISLDDDGQPLKSVPSAYVTRAERVTRDSLGEVMDVLDQLDAHQAVAWGIHAAENDVALVDTKDRVATGKAAAGTIARSRDYMQWGNCGGVLMIDLDKPHTPEEARDLLIRAWNVARAFDPDRDDLTEVEMIYRPSSSAGVVGGAMSAPYSGGRIYMAVEKSEDIPAIGQNLFAGLWLIGMGVIEASESGAALVRSLIDASIWQPERIDYVAPAILGDGLRVDPAYRQVVRWGIPCRALKALSVDISPDVVAEFDRLKSEAIDKAAPMLADVRAEHIRRRVEATRADCEAKGMDAEQTKKVCSDFEQSLHGAVERQQLDLSFRVYLSKDLSRSVTVAEILANPERYHGVTCCDPLEPVGTFGKAIIYTNSAPIIKSYKHGGRIFRLVTQTRHVVGFVEDSQRARYVRNVTNTLNAAFPGQLYRLGSGLSSQLCYITADGRMKALTPAGLQLFASDAIDFEVPKPKSKVMINVCMPPVVAAAIVGNDDDTFGAFKSILKVVPGPILLPATGEVVSDYGYHAGSRMFLALDGDFPPLTVIRDKAEALRVAARLVAPYVDFEFHDEDGHPNHHAATVLSLVLGVHVRPTVLGPNVLVTASRAGVGKTYFVRVQLAEMGVRSPKFVAWSTNDEEAVKRFVAWARKDLGYLAIDNHDGPICKPLDEVTDKPIGEVVDMRILGESATYPVSNVAAVYATGINLRPGDAAMARRSVELVLTDSRAWAGKQMSFPVSPVDYVASHWRERRMLALSLIKWGHEQGLQASGDVLNSMPDYDRYIRRLIVDLYGVDLFEQALETFEEVTASADVRSPKGLLFYYAWEMCRAHTAMLGMHTRNGGRLPRHLSPDRIHTGRMPMVQIDEHEHTAMLAFFDPATVWDVSFTTAHLRAFLAYNNLDEKGYMENIMSRMKGLLSAGTFNGMSLVKTGKDGATKSVLMSVKGFPTVLPIMKNG